MVFAKENHKSIYNQEVTKIMHVKVRKLHTWEFGDACDEMVTVAFLETERPVE